MEDLPRPVDGRKLAHRRRELGVRQQDLAASLGIHRVTLHEWEREELLDPIRAARYERALVSLVERAVA